MNSKTTHIKSPFLAGFFGIIPGLGHLYAGKIGKGFLLGSLLVLSLCIWFSFQQHSLSINGYHSNSIHALKILTLNSFDGHSLNQFSSFSAISFLGLCLFVPLFMVYSIADSVVSILQHNRRILFGTVPIHPPRPQHMDWSSPEQDMLRQGARERGMHI